MLESRKKSGQLINKFKPYGVALYLLNDSLIAKGAKKGANYPRSLEVSKLII